MDGKYLPLFNYLEHRYANTVVLTFQQMEAVLGFALPEGARTEPAWRTDVPVLVTCARGQSHTVLARRSLHDCGAEAQPR